MFLPFQVETVIPPHNNAGYQAGQFFASLKSHLIDYISRKGSSNLLEPSHFILTVMCYSSGILVVFQIDYGSYMRAIYYLEKRRICLTR